MIGIKNVIAVVCGGGPAPGINSVISGVVNEATRQGWDVLGMYDGFSRLARGEKNYVRLEPKNISRIHLTGGCILKMSRFNPTKKESDLRTVVETLTELGVTHLVTIGGDDTAYSSAAVSDYARKMGRTINVVHVPKTIDNDLPLPEGIPTFGFETARAFGTQEVENLMEDARTTNNRWYFTIAMGRTAGHLALGMGRSAGAALTIIPEEFPEDKIPLQQVVDIITGAIVKRYLTGKNYGVAVIAEGVIEKIAPEDFKKLGTVVTDEHGHIRYSELDFGEIIKQAVLRNKIVGRRGRSRWLFRLWRSSSGRKSPMVTIVASFSCRFRLLDRYGNVFLPGYGNPGKTTFIVHFDVQGISLLGFIFPEGPRLLQDGHAEGFPFGVGKVCFEFL